MDPSCIKSGFLFGRPKLTRWIVTSLFVILLIAAIFSWFITTKVCLKSDSPLKCLIFVGQNDLIASLRSLVAIFGFEWSSLNKFISLLSNLRIDNDCDSIRFMDKSRKLKSILFFAIFCSLSFISLKPLFFGPSGDYFIKYFYSIFAIYNIISALYILSIMIELCICLQAVFRFLNRQIVHLHQVSLTRHEPRSSLKYELKIYRYHYSLGIHLMKAADRFARVYVTWFYTEYAYYSILHVYSRLIFKSGSFVQLMFGATSFVGMSYLTLNLIHVNTQSNNILEQLYEISFHSYDLSFRQQLDFCLYRLSKRDVGFTYGNMFVITPNFITSLATITLSIVLAIPNVLKLSG
uniref:Gustatory receptor n=1 Tax=Tetranychus urticae TaxID=32264 RepID=T1KKR7_TETUR